MKGGGAIEGHGLSTDSLQDQLARRAAEVGVVNIH